MNDMAGGAKLMALLQRISENLHATAGEPSVRVGFLEGATYPDGTPVPMVAATQEFGGTIHRDAGETTVYRKTDTAQTHFLRNGRFVKKAEANFSSAHAHEAYTISIPPRPYFRTMIKEKASGWPGAMAKLLKAQDYDGANVLGLMGDLIKGQLQSSITALTSPPLAPSTIARKGSAKPLIDTGHMLNSVDYEVTT